MARPIWHKTFMRIAEMIAEHSTCAKIKVGAVLVKDRKIISTGYNGVGPGLKHCCDIFTAEKIAELGQEEFLRQHAEFSIANELHAEQNAILYLVKTGGNNTEGASMYCTWSPCAVCAKVIFAAGIKEVYYRTKYDDKGIEALRTFGVQVTQV